MEVFDGEGDDKKLSLCLPHEESPKESLLSTFIPESKDTLISEGGGILKELIAVAPCFAAESTVADACLNPLLILSAIVVFIKDLGVGIGEGLSAGLTLSKNIFSAKYSCSETDAPSR